jgi:hypothetical protein
MNTFLSMHFPDPSECIPHRNRENTLLFQARGTANRKGRVGFINDELGLLSARSGAAMAKYLVAYQS